MHIQGKKARVRGGVQEGPGGPGVFGGVPDRVPGQGPGGVQGGPRKHETSQVQHATQGLADLELKRSADHKETISC